VYDERNIIFITISPECRCKLNHFDVPLAFPIKKFVCKNLTLKMTLLNLKKILRQTLSQKVLTFEIDFLYVGLKYISPDCRWNMKQQFSRCFLVKDFFYVLKEIFRTGFVSYFRRPLYTLSWRTVVKMQKFGEKDS